MNTYVLNGTNQVTPMNATNMVGGSMNGTNMVGGGMQGTSSVTPMQGTNGGYYEVHPLAAMHPDDVPLNGIPGDYTDDDVEAYKLAYLVGDPDALNGLFSKLKGKIKKARAGNKAARDDRRGRRAENRALRMEKRKSGTRFIDKFGGALSNVGEALKLKAQSAGALEDNGIDYDDEILEQRSYIAADNGETAGDEMSSGDGATDPNAGIIDKLAAKWAAASTTEKGLVIAGTGLALYLGYKAYTGKKGRKKR